MIAEKARRGKNMMLSPPTSPPPSRPPLSQQQSTLDALNDSHARAQTRLEALPHKILADAKTFHEHLSYFVGSGNKLTVDSGDELPPGLQKLMNEITGVEKLGERIKREILQDEDARHVSRAFTAIRQTLTPGQTLFTLSIERTFSTVGSRLYIADHIPLHRGAPEDDQLRRGGFAVAGGARTAPAAAPDRGARFLAGREWECHTHCHRKRQRSCF